VENPRDPDGRLKKGTERSQATVACSFVKNSLGILVPVFFAELVRGEAFFRAKELPEIPSRPDGYDNEAHQMDYDSIFKTEGAVHNEDTSIMKEDKQNQNTLITEVNRNIQKKEGETPQNEQSADLWTPPKEIIIYFSEQCENYPEAIDHYVLPLVQTEIRVRLII
jgi:hypothetical protein